MTLSCDGARKGRAVYWCIAELIERYPQYDGLLLLHFDCALRFKRAERMNVTDPWATPSWLQRADWTSLPADQRWKWAGEGPKLNSALSELQASSDPDHARYLANFARRVGGMDQRVFGMADVYYLPRRMFADWVKLSAIFKRHDVFGEIAFATMTAMLNDDFERRVHTLDGIWRMENTSEVVQAWRDQPNWLYFHQVPLQTAEGQSIIRESVQQAL